MSNKYITSLEEDFLQREVSINDFSNIMVSGITQSGKTSFVFEYLKNSRMNFIYLDLRYVDDLDFELKNIYQQLTTNKYQIAVFDIYNQEPYWIEKFLELELQLIFISWRNWEIEGFKQIKMFPLSFQEFIHFHNSVESIENIFVKYSKVGGFPIFARSSDNLIYKHIGRLFYFALSDFDIAIIQNVAESCGFDKTALTIYRSIKNKRKISKDKFYQRLQYLIDCGYIIQVEEFNKTFNSRYYLMDQGLVFSFIGSGSFLQVFENMVVAELYKKGKKKLLFYKDIDIFLPDEKLAIISLPFTEKDIIEKRLKKMKRTFKKLQIETVEIITMNIDVEFDIIDEVQIKAVPFQYWSNF